jgi:glutamate racemase
MKSPAKTLGVFDSGKGGLSVLRELHQQSSDLRTIYVDDSAYSPYGTRSREFVLARSRIITQHLIDHGADTIFIACNTATTQVIDDLRTEFKLPFFGIEPAVKPAASLSRTKRLAVAATSGTLRSRRFTELCNQFATESIILPLACPQWVEMIEAGLSCSSDVRASVQEQIDKVILFDADVLVLGCTHFSFLKPIIQELLPSTCVLLDPAPRVAAHILSKLPELTSSRKPLGQGSSALWTSERDPNSLTHFINQWLSDTLLPVKDRSIPDEDDIATMSFVSAGTWQTS